MLEFNSKIQKVMDEQKVHPELLLRLSIEFICKKGNADEFAKFVADNASEETMTIMEEP